jgi:hypothetical protein
MSNLPARITETPALSIVGGLLGLVGLIALVRKIIK